MDKEIRASVELKPGTTDGFQMMKRGGGHEGLNGGAFGDFYITIRVKPHAVFTRKGDNLHIKWPLSFAVAALGGNIEVPTLLHGTMKIHVKPGTQPGATLRMPGKGVRIDRTPGRSGNGAQVIEFEVKIPKQLTERQKELLKEFIQEG